MPRDASSSGVYGGSNPCRHPGGLPGIRTGSTYIGIIGAVRDDILLSGDYAPLLSGLSDIKAGEYGPRALENPPGHR